jgi:hypothetical protein
MGNGGAGPHQRRPALCCTHSTLQGTSRLPSCPLVRIAVMLIHLTSDKAPCLSLPYGRQLACPGPRWATTTD